MIKNIGLGVAGVGALGCIMLPFNYIPSQLGFLAEQKTSTLWGIFIGLLVVGGVMWYMGMKSEKAEEEKNK
jgi:hypothetical protein